MAARATVPLRLAALLLLGLAASCGGCSLAPVAPVGDDPEVKAIAPRVAADRGRMPRLAIAPIEAEYPLAYDLAAEPGRMPFAPDRPALAQALAADIEQHTAFGKPVVLAQEGLEAAAGAAAEEGAEILVLPKLTRCQAFFDRRNGSWVWNVMLWLYFWIPAWFVHDEDYGVEIGMDLTYVSVASERVIHRSSVRAKHLEGLDDFDRGWDFLGIFRAPNSLDAEQMGKVADLLYPYARRDLEARLVVEMGERLPAALADEERRQEIERADASVVALLVGVGKYRDDARIAAPPGPEADVRLVADLLREREGIPAKNVLALEGRAATRFRFDEALAQHVGKRARAKDTVLVYFSGVGASAGDEAFLLPHDANPERLAETAIPLRSLFERLRALPSRRVIVVVDAGFGPRAGGTRSLRGAVAPAGPPSLAALAALTAAPAGKEMALLTATLGGDAAGAGEDAMDLAGSKRGLFTFLLCEGAQGRADADASGDVSPAELGAYVERHVKAQAGLEGVLEAPALFQGGAKVPLASPAGGAPWLPRARDVKGM